MAQKFIVPITVRQLASAGSDAFTIYVDQDVYSRIQIQAGGRIVWGSGDAAADTNLYRDAANVLKTDDTFKAAGLFVDGIEIDPTGAASDQVLKFDGTKFVPGTASTVGLLNDLSDVTTASVATGDVLTWNGTYWTNEEPTGGGASVTVSESAPASPAAGDLWFDSILGVMFIYYDDVWVEVGGGGVVNFVLDTVTAKGDLIVGTADGAADNLAVGANGTYLKANSSTATGLEWASVPAIDAAAIISAAGGDGTNGQALTTNGSGVLDFTTIVGTTEASIISAVGADGAAGSVLKTNGSGDLSFGDVALGTNTSGIYVADLVSGTGVTITNGSSESASPTIAIGQSVATSASVQFAAVTAPLIGNASTATTLQTARNIAGQSFDGSANISISPTDLTGVTSSAAEINILDGATLSTTELNYVDGVTSAIQTQLDNKASSTASPVITLGGDLSGSATFTNLGNATLTATIEPNSVALGTDTTGNYMSDLTQGTGVTITHTPGEGSNATIAIGQAVGTSASVTFAHVTAPITGNVTGNLVGDVTGNADTATALETARTIELSGDVSGSASFDGTSNINIFTTVNTASVSIGELYGVNITNPEEFQTLEYNGTEWVNTYSSLVSYVRNAEATTITTGTPVYLFGSTGDHASVKRADNSSDTTSSKTVGVAGVNISASENGPVVTRGYVDGIDLSVGYNPGDVLWLGKNGQFTTAKPSAPDHLVFIGVVVRASNNGIIYVATQNGYELEELHDVKLTSPTDGQFLRYNSASTVWVNDTINLGTDTAGDYVQNLVAGTGVTLTNNSGESATPTVAIGQDVSTSASVTFARLIVQGDMEVQGTITRLNETNLDVDTAFIYLNANSASANPDMGIAFNYDDGTYRHAGLFRDSSDGIFKVFEGYEPEPVSPINTSDATYSDARFQAESLILTQVTGTAPMSVSSSTVVTNLNADKLDGQDGSYYAPIDSPTFTGTVSLPNNTVALGTQTTGNYVADVSGGTGVNVSHTPGEGTTPSIAIGQDVATSASVTFAAVTAPIVGNASTASTLQTPRTISLSGDVSGSVSFNGSANVDISATIQPNSVTLGTDTTGNYVSDVVVGTGLTISHTPGEGSSASVSLNATLDDLSNVTVTSPTAGDLLTYNGSVWTSASASGGASLEVSATAPTGPEEGNLWFNSTTLETYIYYDGHWLQASGEPDLVEDLTDLSDVLFTAPVSGQFLKFDGTRWVNGTIPTINTLDDIGDVSASVASPGQFLKWNGTAWVPETIIGGATISDSAPAAPLAGQLWFDSTVGKTFVYYDSQWIEVGGVGTGARMVSSSSAPASPLEGSMWFDTDTAQTFVYYDSSWIEIGASGITASVQDSAPAAPVSGQIWFNSLTGGTYVYYGTNWIEVGASPFSALVNTINAKGDLLVGTADNTIGGLTAGSNNQVLTVDSSTATGLKWATPVSTGKAIAMSIVFGG